MSISKDMMRSLHIQEDCDGSFLCEIIFRDEWIIDELLNDVARKMIGALTSETWSKYPSPFGRSMVLSAFGGHPGHYYIRFHRGLFVTPGMGINFDDVYYKMLKLKHKVMRIIGNINK